MKCNVKPKTVTEVDVTEMRLTLKVRDEFSATFHGADGTEVGDYEGYVPGFMPGDHYGDYVELTIDVDTGLIKNWRKTNDPKWSKLADILNGGEADDASE